MPQATLDPRWVPKDKCPLQTLIHSVAEINETIKGRPYVTMRLILNAAGEFYQYDAKFGDKNFLINTFGPDTDEWIGKEIWITVNPETTYKQISMRVGG